MHFRLLYVVSVFSLSCISASFGVDRLRDAESLVKRYVIADLDDAGMSDSISSLFLDCERQGTDRLEPVQDYRIVPAGFRGDTVLISVRYAVLGYATSYDHSMQGSKNWSFSPRPHDVVDTFRVVRVGIDGAATLRIMCDGFPGNRVGLDAMSWYVERFDDSSLSMWNDLLRVQPELDPVKRTPIDG